MSMEYDYHECLVCDDLNIEAKPIPKEALKKIPEYKGKVIHGTFGKFSIADFERIFKGELNEH